MARVAAPHRLFLLCVWFIPSFVASSVIEKFPITADKNMHHASAKLDDQTTCVFSYSAEENNANEEWEILLAKQDSTYKCIIDNPSKLSQVRFQQFAASIIEKEIMVAEAFDAEGEAMLEDDEFHVTPDAIQCILGMNAFRGGLSKVNIKSQ